MYCVWNLQAKRHQKWRLTLIFGVGLLYVLPYLFFPSQNMLNISVLNSACAASVTRFAYTVTLVESPDVTWNLAILSLWRYSFPTKLLLLPPPSPPTDTYPSQCLGNLRRLHLLLSPSLPPLLRTRFPQRLKLRLLLLSLLIHPFPQRRLDGQLQIPRRAVPRQDHGGERLQCRHGKLLATRRRWWWRDRVSRYRRSYAAGQRRRGGSYSWRSSILEHGHQGDDYRGWVSNVYFEISKSRSALSSGLPDGSLLLGFHSWVS